MGRPSPGVALCAAATLLLLASSSAVPQTPAPQPPPSEHLQNMEAEQINIRAESEHLGGSPSPGRSLENMQTLGNALDGTIGRMEGVAIELGASVEALEALSRQVGEAAVISLDDAPSEAKEEGFFQCLQRVCTRYGFRLAARAAAWVPWVGDAIGYGGRLVYREINEARIREMARNEQIRLSDMYNLLATLRCQRADIRATVNRLTALRERERFLAAEIARERARLADRAGPARRHARLGRDRDAADDAEQERLDREARRRSGTIGPADPAPRAPQQHSMAPLDGRSARLLAIHNAERAAVGVPPLGWDPALQASATSHAAVLARAGRRIHATKAERGGAGENLNQGMLGWNTDQMMRNWTVEKSHFRPGIFPNVCAGDWSKCGHYSQMIWPTTTRVGCGMATGSGYQWLVCRYAPSGNRDGKPVGLRPADVATAAPWAGKRPPGVAASVRRRC